MTIAIKKIFLRQEIKFQLVFFLIFRPTKTIFPDMYLFQERQAYLQSRLRATSFRFWTRTVKNAILDQIVCFFCKKWSFLPKLVISRPKFGVFGGLGIEGCAEKKSNCGRLYEH